MAIENHSEELLNLLRALADANRLKIIGLLAKQPYTVEQLGALLGVGVSTVSHHLRRLSKAGLVSARADGYYSVYSLQMDVLSSMAKRLLHKEDLPELAADVDLDSFDRKVLATFTGPDGKIKEFPAQEKKFLVILRHVVQSFKPGVRYSEKRVNEILSRFSKDTAKLSRGLVDHHLMAREGGGGEYWRIEER